MSDDSAYLVWAFGVGCDARDESPSCGMEAQSHFYWLTSAEKSAQVEQCTIFPIHSVERPFQKRLLLQSRDDRSTGGIVWKVFHMAMSKLKTCGSHSSLFHFLTLPTREMQVQLPELPFLSHSRDTWDWVCCLR